MVLKPPVARYALTDRGQRPLLTEALPLAERVHRALVELSDGSAVFTGCDKLHRPLQGHRHAHILCESNPGSDSEGRGEITEISIYAPMGFGSGEQNALQRLKEIYDDHGGILDLLYLGSGSLADCCRTGRSPLFTRSKCWVSHTPFLPTRHPKATRAGVPKLDSNGRQIGSPEHDILRLLELAGFPEVVAIEPVSSRLLGGRAVPWQEFIRRRATDERRPAANGAGYGFRIEFAEAVQGFVNDDKL